MYTLSAVSVRLRMRHGAVYLRYLHWILLYCSTFSIQVLPPSWTLSKTFFGVPMNITHPELPHPLYHIITLNASGRISATAKMTKQLLSWKTNSPHTSNPAILQPSSPPDISQPPYPLHNSHSSILHTQQSKLLACTSRTPPHNAPQYSLLPTPLNFDIPFPYSSGNTS